MQQKIMKRERHFKGSSRRGEGRGELAVDRGEGGRGQVIRIIPQSLSF